MLNSDWQTWFVGAWLMVQAASPLPAQERVVMTVDPANSQVTIAVGTAGMFGFAGHPHEVVAPAVSGRVMLERGNWQQSSVSLEFDAGALRVTGKGEPAGDVPEVQRVMLGEKVLDVRRFPTITFQSRRIAVEGRNGRSGEVVMEGDLTLHGVTRPVTVRANVRLDPGGALIARGTSTIKQTHFGITPVTAGLGTVRVKDEVDLQFVVTAIPTRQ